MKKILITLAILPLSMSLMAQKLDLGLGGGASKNLKPSFAKSNDKSGNIAPVLYAQASLKLIGFQFGIRGEFTRFVFRGNKVNYGGYTVPAGDSYVDLVYGDKVFNVRAFVNKTFAISRVEPYMGINAGYSSAGSDKSVSNKTLTDDLSGFTAGIQAGVSVFVTSHFGINAQASFDYYNLNPANQLDASGHLFSPALTLGLRYRL